VRTYDALGRLDTRTLSDTSGEEAPDRVWDYDYIGINVSEIDGPLPGDSDAVSFTWSGANLTSITNEIGQTTNILGHNPIGAPTVIEDPNGVRTRIVYDPEHRVTNIIENDGVGGLNATTTITYTAVDLVKRITQPNGVWMEFEYDDARRLTEIKNSANERIVLTLNTMGGVTKQEILGSDDVKTFSVDQVIDEINRVREIKTLGAVSGESITKLDYDRENNLTDIEDPRQYSWSNSFDGLDRLKQQTDPLTSTVDYDYATIDNGTNPLTKVSDQRGIETLYARNGFGDLVREVSLERGTTDYEYDERGLVTKMTDARGVNVDYVYDDAGRLLSEDYSGGTSDDVTYEYDQGPYGIGRLTAVVEGFGRTDYGYSPLGFLTSETRTLDGQTYTTGYTHDLAGNVLTTTYPSGLTVELTRDSLARIEDIDLVRADGTRVDILSGSTYRPYGGVTRATYGDGNVLDITYDGSDRATRLTRGQGGSALMDIGFTHDKSGNITGMQDYVRPNRSQTFIYDELSRLTEATGAYRNIDYSYNERGDRRFRTIKRANGQVVNKLVTDVEPGTARISSIKRNGAPYRQFTYAASGQITSDTKNGVVMAMTLNARGRMASVTRDGVAVADYGYDVNQHRVSKTLADGSVIHYHYDAQGRMMAETDGLTGATIRDYIWFGLSPVAVDSAADGLHYIHTDHLGRPAFVTDPSGTSVWDGGITTPFGYSLGVVGTFTQKLMFPGQYRDEETGYDQNWNRTYDPELGRYLQSDPIGLAGGLNRYAYVGGNPVMRVDPTGLFQDAGGAYRTSAAYQRSLIYGRAAVITQLDSPYLPFADLFALGFIIGAEGQLLYNSITATKPQQCRDGLSENQQRVCKELLDKIENIKRQVLERETDIRLNLGNLPEFGPGPNRSTRQGHRRILRKLERRLKELEDRYFRECR